MVTDDKKKKFNNGIKPRLLTAQEAGIYLGLHTETIYQMGREGEFQPVRIGQRYIRYDIHELEDWIQQKKESELAEFSTEI